jgi:hypothetical protein
LGGGGRKVVYGGGRRNKACNKSILLVRGETVKKDYDGNIKSTTFWYYTGLMCTDTCV